MNKAALVSFFEHEFQVTLHYYIP